MKPRKTKKEREIEHDVAFDQFVKEAKLMEVAPMQSPQGTFRVFAYQPVPKAIRGVS